MNIDEIVRKFQQFLEASWQSVENMIPAALDRHLPAEDLRLDWLQANWEILVEAIIRPDANSFLEVYGEGADCNGASSRVWLPDADPTHRVCCVPKYGNYATDLISGRSIETPDLTFFGFVNWDGKWHAIHPPFNVVLLENRTDEFIVRLEDVRFELQAMPIQPGANDAE